jgi:hypothetical protein
MRTDGKATESGSPGESSIAIVVYEGKASVHDNTITTGGGGGGGPSIGIVATVGTLTQTNNTFNIGPGGRAELVPGTRAPTERPPR